MITKQSQNKLHTYHKNSCKINEFFPLNYNVKKKNARESFDIIQKGREKDSCQ